MRTYLTITLSVLRPQGIRIVLQETYISIIWGYRLQDRQIPREHSLEVRASSIRRIWKSRLRKNAVAVDHFTNGGMCNV